MGEIKKTQSTLHSIETIDWIFEFYNYITFVIIHYNQQAIAKVFNRTNCVTTRENIGDFEECKIWGLTRKIRDKRPLVRSTTDIFLQSASESISPLLLEGQVN